MNNEGVRSTKRMSDTGDSGMSAYFSSKGSQLSKANPKNVYLPESTPEEKAKIQSDRLAVKGEAAKAAADKKAAAERVDANSKSPPHDFKGDTSLDLSNPKSKSDAGPKAKPVVKAAPKVKSQFEKMRDVYSGFGKGSDSAANKAIQSRIEGKGEAKAPAMKKGGSACKGYAKGGSVKSSASSRGDGCATKGHTRGAMR